METTAITNAAPKGRRNRKIFALILGSILFAVGALSAVALAAGPPDGTLRYTWSIGDRYGVDANGDGIVDNPDGIGDLAKDKAFIQSPTYKLTFDTCASPAVTERSSLITGYVLTLTGPETKTVNGDNCKIVASVSKLGSYTAKVEIKVGPVTVDSRTETITPKDHLVASVGDSVASGEGNPDTLESGTFWSPKWQNKQCHRTSLAGPAQAALRMERRDPHSAITFVHLACSGASITTGLLGDYIGQDPSAGTVLKPQLDQLKDLVGTRPVDALTVSIGANDAEFANVVKACLIQTNCHLPNGTGQKNGVELFDEKAPLITKNYALLDARLDKMAKQEPGDVKLRGKVFITEYMDVTKDDDGTYCTGKTAKEREAGRDAGGTSNTDGINQAEMTWADTYVQDGLNKRVTDGIAEANKNGGAQIQFVGGIKAKFANNGYCAQDRWIRTLTESGLYQRGIDGAFHPNAEGHLFGYADRIEDTLVPALGIEGEKLPLKFDDAGQLGDNLGAWLATLDQTGALDQITNALPFGAREEVQKFIRDKFFGKFLPWVQQAATDGVTSVTELSERLDDLDGDGNPGVDAFGIANLDLDMTGDIQPKLPSKVYDITFTIKGSVALDPDLALKAGKLGLTGQKSEGKAEFSQTVKLHIDFTKPETDRFHLTIPKEGLNGEIKIALGGDYGGTDGPANGPDKPAITFTAGALGLKAVGPAQANVAFGYSIKDPSGDGRIDATEMGNPLAWIKAGCVSGSANVDLKASSSLAGFTSTLGRISLVDPNLCDGIATPTVDLSELGQFEGITPIEFVNGLAQLTTALKGIQSGNDLDIPFVKESLASVIDANERLVKFFTDNGLTDPNNPMANITFDPTKRPDLDTLEEILPKLSSALGIPMEQLNPRVVDQRLLLDLGFTLDPAAKAGAGELDFGDQLSRTGVAEVKANAKATIDPMLKVDLGFGIDLRPDLAFADRYFFQLKDGAEITADAKVTADATLSAKLALLDLDLADDNPTGAVTLLDRKDATKPMLAIDIKGTVTGTNDDNRLTLAELTTPTTTAKSPFKVTLNGKVPTFGLTAQAKLAGVPFASGKVTIGWADITDPAQLTVTADGGFKDTLLPFAYDASNPRATITQILKAAHTGVSQLRSSLGTNAAITRTLPLTGKSAAEIDPILAKLEEKLAQLIELDETLTLDQVESRIEKELGEALAVANDKWPGLVTFRYEPQTATKNAALLADIKIGFCSDSRKALPGCNKITEIGPFPLNLSLGQGTDSMAAVTADGRVGIGYDARLALTVGVELPRVTPSTTPGGVPTVSGAPKVFVHDTSSFELGIGARVSGQFAGVLGPVEVTIGSSAKPASASLAARFSIKSKTADPANPQRIYDGSIPTWVSSIIPNPASGGNVHDTTSTASGCANAADACATLPVTINGAYVGDIAFAAPDLLTPSGWTVNAQDVLASLGNENIQFAILVGGIESFVERLETSLRNMPAGKNIPLLGIDPTAGADVLEDFRTGVVVPAQDLVNKINASNRAGLVRTEVQDFLYAKLGPDSELKLLRDGPDADTAVTKADIVVELKCKVSGTVRTCQDTDTATSIDDLLIKLPLARAGEVTSKPLDSGFPGLKLKSKEGFSASAGFEMDLAFGVDRANGFYIPTGAFGSQPELRVQATASVPSEIDAQLAFIPVKLLDKTPGVPEVAATIGVDLAAGGSDGKITLGQLGSASITPSLQACGNLRLGLETGASKKFPAFKADLALTGGYSCVAGGVTGAPASNAGINIAFDNVRVNAGSVINDFIGPAAQTVRKYTGPLEPTIDALRKPIPGIKEAARAIGATPPTWWDLMNAINDIRMAAGEKDQLSMIKKVMVVSDLARQLAPGVGNAQDISLGSFKLDSATAANPSKATDIDALLTGENFNGDISPILSRLQGAGIPLEISNKVQPTAPYQSLTFPAFEKPQRLFELLLGKDVPIVRFEAGGSFLHVPIGPYSFPVGPATVYFGGALDLSGHFAAGFDTYGIRQAYSMLTDEDPTNDSFGQAAAGILGGFYLDDYDANGKDVPELRAQAEVTVGAGVGIPGFGVFAEGGVHADAQIDLKTTDGKLRPEQIVKQLRKNPNPVCIFDAKARIDAFVRVVVSNPIKDVHFPIADAVILDEPDLTAFCNIQQSDTQAKVTGTKYTDGTLELFSSAESDRILVTQRDTAGTVDVSSKGVVERFEGITKIFVDGAAGDDQITLTTDSPRASAIAAHVCGGAGKDHISVDIGPATIYGDAGQGSKAVENGVDKALPCAAGPGAADSIQGGPDADTISGMDGNDDLTGGDGKDKVTGGNGDDTILPGAGDDTVDGGANTDIVSYSDRSDAGITVDLRAGATSGATGTPEKDALTSIETGVGGPRNDVLWAPAVGTVLDGGYGNDTLNGGAGPDLLVGGAGEDALLGGEGMDLLVGAFGNDRMVGNADGDTYQGGEGNDIADYSAEPGPVTITLNGQPDDGRSDEEQKDNVFDAEVVLGTTGADHLAAGAVPAELHGLGGDDTIDGPGKLYGGDGDDVLRGSELNDVLSGGPGTDDLLGRGGQDDLDAGTGDDHLDGGFGPDRMAGGDGFDTVDYSSRVNTVLVRLTDGARDGEGVQGSSSVNTADCIGLFCDEVRPDNEKIVGGSGDDTLDGDLGNQVLVGNDGNDDLQGHAGIDRFEGGAGNDDARDQDYYYSKPDAAGTGDTWIMGEGDDYVGGSGGDEHIELGNGNDRGTLDGTGEVFLDMGPGNDTFDTDFGDHTVIGGTGDDRLQTYAGVKDIDMGEGDDVAGMMSGAYAKRAIMGPGNDEFDGANTDPGPDVIDGGPGDDFLIGSGGNDTITDLEGANAIYAGAGNDKVSTGPGSDESRGEDGDDVLTDAGNDGRNRQGYGPQQYLWGGNGNDSVTMTGSSGDVEDNITGDAGNDVLKGGAGPQSMQGGDGNDDMDGGAGQDRLNGGNHDDTVRGGDGDDLVQGGDGTNLLFGGNGADRLEGGAGKDTVSYADRNAPVTVTQGINGADDGNATDDSAIGTPAKRDDVAFTVETVIGTELDDVMTVGSLSSSETGDVDGRGGKDTLIALKRAKLTGGAGDDTLIGSDEVDTLVGGLGNDLLAGGLGADSENGGDGNDRLDQGPAIDGGDALVGGPGTDVADYSARPAGQAIAFTPGAGGANDGASGEADDADATVESARTQGQATAAPTITVTPAKTTAVSGETVNVTVTVTGGNGIPTGAVEVTDNIRAGSAVLDATGKAVIPVRFENTGNRSVVATYRGSSTYRAATSAGATVVVGKVGTSTQLEAINSPTKLGAQTKLRITLRPQVGSLVVAGSVAIKEGATTLQTVSVADGQSDVTLTTPLSLGRHDLVAVWPGTNGTETSTSQIETVLVTADGKAPAPAVTVTTDPSSPAGKAPVTVAANLTPVPGAPAPTGAVTFTAVGTDPVRESVVLGEAQLFNGFAALPIPEGLAGGSYTITATYPGSATSAGATGTKAVTVGRTATTTTLATSQNPATTDAPVTFTATVTRSSGSGTPTGKVTFLDGTEVLGTATVGTDGKATLSRPLLLGTHPVTARYEGSDSLAPSTSAALSQVVNTPSGTTGVATTTAVVRNGANLVATVTPASGTATGQVRFTLDGVAGTPVDLSGTTATIPVPAWAPGDHTVVATYLGSATHATSTSPTLTVTVNKVATTTTVVRSGNNLVATVAPASGTATGQVQFTLDGVAGTPVNLSGTTATIPVPAWAPGDHTVVATYLGSATHATSASAQLKITVSAGAAPSAPGTPGVTAATATSATIQWGAPASTGGSAITTYRVTVKADVAGTVVSTFETPNANRFAVVDGLTPGRLYRFSVAARNGTGLGAESALSAHALPPFKSLDAFTDRQYRDFANRVPTATELANWRTQLANGSATPQALVNQAVDFPHAARIAPITRLFNAFFLRLPDKSGLDYWVGKYRNGTGLNTISANFAGSSEFKNRYGALSNRDFVLLIYKNVLQRNPDTSGVNYWTGKLDRGMSRGQVMTNFSESSEYKRKSAAITDLVVPVRSMLLRVPTAAERTEWEAKLKAGTPRTELLAWILTLPAYDARV